jgi:hypothetical protein
MVPDYNSYRTFLIVSEPRFSQLVSSWRSIIVVHETGFVSMLFEAGPPFLPW